MISLSHHAPATSANPIFTGVCTNEQRNGQNINFQKKHKFLHPELTGWFSNIMMAIISLPFGSVLKINQEMAGKKLKIRSLEAIASLFIR